MRVDKKARMHNDRTTLVNCAFGVVGRHRTERAVSGAVSDRRRRTMVCLRDAIDRPTAITLSPALSRRPAARDLGRLAPLRSGRAR